MATDIVKCITCNIVINELLCFIQNKMNVMDEKSLVLLSMSAFSKTEISAAKDLLFASINTSIPNVSRRVDKEKKELQDIIRVFKNIEPDNTPTFVAKELHKLPALSFEHVDVSRVLKDIILLQSEVKTIKESYITIDDLKDIKAMIHNMKYASLINSDPSLLNVNKKRGGCLLEDSGPFGILNLSSTHTAKPNETHSGDECDRSNRFVNEEQSSVSASHTVANIESDEFVKNKSFKEALLHSNEIKPVESNKCNNESWKLVESKKRNKNRRETVRGKAIIRPCDKFKPANLKTPLFVSNVHKETSESDIIEYILSKTKESVSLQKIKMKTERSYNCYKIIVPKHKISVFLDDELWPDGITCRHFLPYRIRGSEEEQQRIVTV